MTIDLAPPSGVTSAIGADGVTYTVAAGIITVPNWVAPPLFAAGWYLSTLSGGSTGGTGGTGGTGQTGRTGADRYDRRDGGNRYYRANRADVMVAALLSAPNRLPLTAGERLDRLEAQQMELLRAHNELADAVLALSVQVSTALGILAKLTGEAAEAPDLPSREPFKQHRKRH